MFKSSLEAIQGKDNPLALPKKKKIAAVLVDGMGAEQIIARQGHAKFLADRVAAKQTAFSAFPATTSSNIGSFATGLLPGKHGLVGHQVLDRTNQIRINLLTGWTADTDPLVWQPFPTISEISKTAGVPCYVIAASEYEKTGYTNATMRDAKFIAAESIADRFGQMLEVMRAPGEALIYLYVPELDKYGHRNGWQSAGWAALLEEINHEIKSAAGVLPADSAMLVTADHGMVDTTEQDHVLLDNYFDSSLEWFGGDTRAGFVYLNDVAGIEPLLKRLDSLSNLLSAHATKDLITAGYFGEVGELASARLPELVLLAKGKSVMFHSEYSKKKSFEMVAHHGSVSSAELRIPLIRIGF